MTETIAQNERTQIQDVRVTAYSIPTDRPESDGTLEWDETTMVLVQISAGGRTGLGYTYAHAAAGKLIHDKLASVVQGMNPFDIPACWQAMTTVVRNNGESGLSRMAISAVDGALWDLKAKLLDMSLIRLLGAVREEVPAYGSGGFTSYTIEQLQEQLGGWAEEGFSMVKMKIGRQPQDDPGRIVAARKAIGDDVSLFVDANGGYSQKQALALAERFSQWGVSWYEEPVSHLDLDGLHFLQQRTPGGVEVTAGEYGFDLGYFRRMIHADAVDVLQADATRCGITGFLQVGTLCETYYLPMSSHCAPSLHLHVCCSLPVVRHMEYFHDHVRIEHMLFDGAATAENGTLRPDLTRPGLGLDFKEQDVCSYAISTG
ncbi:MAG: enolase C-terminal domain-like protein [Solirubrobacterales bacterium]